MRTRLQVNANHLKRSWEPITRSLLQRKARCAQNCACSSCGGKTNDSIHRPPIAPRFQHDFSRVSVHPQTALTDFQLPPDWTEEMRPSVEEEPLTDYQSGTCQNGGAQSACNPDTGIYSMVRNDNTCCTKDCTIKHEAVHKKDADNWGCCKALGAAVKAKPADRAELIKKYGVWRAATTDITECNAYTSDEACADALAKTKDCSGAGKNTDCCKDILSYKANAGANALVHCRVKQKTVPSCPF